MNVGSIYLKWILISSAYEIYFIKYLSVLWVCKSMINWSGYELSTHWLIRCRLEMGTPMVKYIWICSTEIYLLWDLFDETIPFNLDWGLVRFKWSDRKKMMNTLWWLPIQILQSSWIIYCSFTWIGMPTGADLSWFQWSLFIRWVIPVDLLLLSLSTC